MIEVYLDYNGSSPLDPRVGKAMWPALAEWCGNSAQSLAEVNVMDGDAEPIWNLSDAVDDLLRKEQAA